jgi:hypothetical protein
MRDSILSIALTGVLALGASPVLAGWTLDPERSAVTYVTIKSTNIPRTISSKRCADRSTRPARRS